MMELTEADVDFLINILTGETVQYGVSDGVKVAERLKELKKLWTKEGLPIREVDVVWRGTISDPAIHTYNVGDAHEDFSDWRVTDLRAYAVEHVPL